MHLQRSGNSAVICSAVAEQSWSSSLTWHAEASNRAQFANMARGQPTVHSIGRFSFSWKLEHLGSGLVSVPSPNTSIVELEGKTVAFPKVCLRHL